MIKDRTGDGLFYNSDGLIADNINHFLLKFKIFDKLSWFLLDQGVKHDFKVRHIDDVSRVCTLKRYSDIPRLFKAILTRKFKKYSHA